MASKGLEQFPSGNIYIQLADGAKTLFLSTRATLDYPVTEYVGSQHIAQPEPAPVLTAENIGSVSLLANLITDTGDVYSVGFSPDGKLIALGCWDPAYVVIWDVADALATGGAADPKFLLEPPEDGGNESIQNILFSADSARIIVAGYNYADSIVWDTTTGDKVGELLDPRNKGDEFLADYYSATPALDLDGNYLATFFEPDIGLRSFNIVTGEELALKDIQADTYKYSPDGSRIAYIRTGGSVILTDANDTVITTISSGPPEARAVDFSPDGSRLLVGSNAGVAIYDVITGEEVNRVFQGSVWDVEWSPDGSLVAAGLSKTVIIFDAATGNRVAEIPQASYVSSVDFSPDGTLLVVGLWSSRAYVWGIAAQ